MATVFSCVRRVAAPLLTALIALAALAARPAAAEPRSVTGGELALEGDRAIWQLGQVQLFDGGVDGDAETAADNTLFATQGIFVP